MFFLVTAWTAIFQSVTLSFRGWSPQRRAADSGKETAVTFRTAVHRVPRTDPLETKPA